MKVRDVMEREVVCVRADDAVRETVGSFLEREITGAPVLDEDGTLVGVVGLGDLARAARGKAAVVPVQRGSDYYRSPWPRSLSPVDALDEELDPRFRVEDYSESVTVREVMTPAAYTVAEETSLDQAAELLAQSGIHRLLVSRDGRMVGIVTSMGLLEVLQGSEEAASRGVAEIMQRQVITVPADMEARELVDELLCHGITGAPVVAAHGAPVGVVSLTDLAGYAARPHDEERGTEAPRYYRDLWMDAGELIGRFSVEDLGGAARAEDLMTPFVVKLDEHERVGDLIELMLGARIHRVLITARGGRRIVGIVTTTDLMRLLRDVLRKEMWTPAP